MYLLTYCIQNLLSTHRQPDAEQPHNAPWTREQRPNPMRTVAAATQGPSRNATLTDAERAQRRKRRIECPTPPITPAGPGRQDALNAARRAVPDAVAAITGTDESIANSIEALSLPLRGF